MNLTIEQASDRLAIERNALLGLQKQNSLYKVGQALGVIGAISCIAIIIINGLGMSGHLSTIHLASSNFTFSAIALGLGLSIAKIHEDNVQLMASAFVGIFVVAFIFMSFFAANIVALKGVISTHTLGAITICSPLAVVWAMGAGAACTSNLELSNRKMKCKNSIEARTLNCEKLQYRTLLNPTGTLIAQAAFILTWEGENDPFYQEQQGIWERLSGGFRRHHGERMYALLLEELATTLPQIPAARFARLEVNLIDQG